MNAHRCPVCHYETFEYPGSFEICCVCNWQDELVEYRDFDEVIGGANSDYSLREARENFERFGTMYRPTDEDKYPTNPEYLIAKWAIN